MKMLAFGYHPIKSIINSKYFRIKKIILEEERYRKDRELLNLIEGAKTNYDFLARKNFLRQGYPEKSQGVVALLDDYLYSDFYGLLDSLDNSNNPLIIMLDSIEDPHNFGAILRTAAAFSVDGIIIANRNQVPVNSTVIKVSAGGIAFVPVTQVNSLSETVDKLKERGYQVIATVCGEESTVDIKQIVKIRERGAVCLIFGNEHQGVKSSLIKKSTHLFSINITSEMESLNVSAACAATLFLLQKNNNTK